MNWLKKYRARLIAYILIAIALLLGPRLAGPAKRDGVTSAAPVGFFQNAFVRVK